MVLGCQYNVNHMFNKIDRLPVRQRLNITIYITFKVENCRS